MWYFSWILGLGLACTLAILWGMWFELKNQPNEKNEKLIEK